MICRIFSRSPIPAKLIGSAEIVRSTGITAKKSTPARRAQRVSGTEKRRKRGKMCDDRCAERDERGTPVMRVKMIGGRDFDQFVAAGKLLRQ